MDSRRTALARALSTTWRSTKLAQVLVVVLALAMFGYRFMHQRTLVFINDEGFFLTAAYHDILAKTWASASPIAGTQGVNYGPMPIWFYRAVQTLFGFAPHTSILAMGCVVTGSQIIFAFCLTRGLRGGAYVFAAIAAFIASSPYQFMWSRMAWDPLVDAMSCVIVAALCRKDPFAGWRPLLLGTLAGIAMSSHPMVAPLLVSVAILTVVELRRSRMKLARTILLASLPAAFINLPFALYVAKNFARYRTSASTIHAHVGLATYLARFLEPARVAGVSGMEYFFDDSWNDFVSWCGNWGPLLQSLRFPLVLAFVALAGVLLSLRSASRVARRVAFLALFTWCGQAAFIASRGVDPHPHYQFTSWWVIAAGIALLITWVRARAPNIAPLFMTGAWAVACVQFAFIVAWMNYVDARTGTNGIHYASPEVEERRAVRDACSRVGANIEIDNLTHNFNIVLDYIATVDPGCAHKAVRICGRTPHCTALADAGIPFHVYQLSYASALGGALVIAASPTP
ncbi:MAG: hypothetical protein ABI183_12255 [Polyangiaceae bacterium]